MFDACTSLRRIVGMGRWDTRNLRDIKYMFQRCTTLEYIDMSHWDLSSLEEAKDVFDGCSAPVYINYKSYVKLMTVLGSTPAEFGDTTPSDDSIIRVTFGDSPSATVVLAGPEDEVQS